MSNFEFDAQEIFNPAQDDYIDHAEHAEQTRQMEEEQAAEWQDYLASEQAKLDALLTEEQMGYEPSDEEQNDWMYDEPIDYGE